MELSSGQPKRFVFGMITADSRRGHFSLGFGKVRDGLNNFEFNFLHFLAKSGKELPFG